MKFTNETYKQKMIMFIILAFQLVVISSQESLFISAPRDQILLFSKNQSIFNQGQVSLANENLINDLQIHTTQIRILETSAFQSQTIKIENPQNFLLEQGQLYSVYQSSWNATFQIEIQSQIPKFILIETRKNQKKEKFNSNIRPNLLFTQYNTPPGMIRNNRSLIISADYADQNGFYQQQEYLFNIINITEIDVNQTSTGIWFCSMIMDESIPELQYQIQITYFDNEKPCPNNCTQPENGQCVNGKCVCSDNFIDQDCSVYGTMLQTDLNWVSRKIEPSMSDITYFFVNVPNEDMQNIDLKFQKSLGSQFYIYISIDEGIESALPNMREKMFYVIFNQNERNMNFTSLSLQGLNQVRGKQLYIGVYLNIDQYKSLSIVSDSSREISITYEIYQKSTDGSFSGEQDSVKNIIILCAILVSMLFSIISCCWKKFQNDQKRRQNMNTLLRTNEANSDNATQYTVAEIQLIQKQKQEDQLKFQEAVDKMMPLKSFEELKNSVILGFYASRVTSLPQCTVCLSDIQRTHPVRQTICNHIFHQDCIDPWLDNNQTCPVCRRNHDLSDILNEIEKLKQNDTLEEKKEDIEIEVDKRKSILLSGFHLPENGNIPCFQLSMFREKQEINRSLPWIPDQKFECKDITLDNQFDGSSSVQFPINSQFNIGLPALVKSESNLWLFDDNKLRQRLESVEIGTLTEDQQNCWYVQNNLLLNKKLDYITQIYKE